MAQKASFSGKFLDCVINKHRPLGIGSYGAVYEATYEELLCAAKVLHTNLFEIQSHRKLLERFEQECELLRTIRHPCIVQFLGIARDPQTTLPVLVTELMEESLTKFLERSDTELPVHLQVNLCHDVALALAYLHSRDITHRDLSSNNVLLIAGTRAKVTDFGTSVFKNRGRMVMTSCPGTQAYMAPECFGEKVQYSQSIDCFSFGVLAVQIVTRKFPNPTARFDRAPPPRSFFNLGKSNPNQVYMRVIPEVDRRQNHLSLVSTQNPLRQIFMDCLNDTESARPSARDLCRDLAAIKEGSPLYKESIDNASDYQFSVIQQCDATRDELQSTASELRKTRSEIDDYRRENERLLLKNQSLEKQISELGQRVTELDIQVLDSEQKQRSTQGRGLFKLFGDRDKEALDKAIQELKEVQTQKLSLQKKVTALQTELEQNRQDIILKDREIREKSDRILNIRDKMDVLEVELSLERIRASSSDERVTELEENVQELEESKDNLEVLVDELEQQIEDLKESTELDLKTLEKVCCEEITQRDKKIKKQSTMIEELKKSNRLDRENLEMVGREEISQRDEKLEKQRKEMELLKRQLKKTISPDRELDRKPKLSPLIIEIQNHSEDVHQHDLESICLSDDSEDTIESFKDEFESEKQPTVITNEDDSSVHLKKEWPSFSRVSTDSCCSKLESYAADSEDLFPRARQHSPSLHTSLTSGNHYSDKEELSENYQPYCSSPKESNTLINDFDTTSSLSATPKSLQVPQDRESSPCDDSSTQPSSSTGSLLTTSMKDSQAYNPLHLLLLMAASIGTNPCQLPSPNTRVSQSPPDVCASEYDESIPILESKSDSVQVHQSQDQVDSFGVKQQTLHSEKSSVRDQGSQTTIEQPVQNLDKTLSNPPQNVVSPQTQHQSTLASGSGAAASPSCVGQVSLDQNVAMVSQEAIPSPTSKESQTISVPQYSGMGTKPAPDSSSETQLLRHQSEQQSSTNYNVLCNMLQQILLNQQLSQASQTGQLQNSFLGKPYPQAMNEQQQREHREQSLAQCEQSQVYPLRVHPSRVQPPSGPHPHHILQRTSHVQPSQPPPVQQTQAQTSQVWSPLVQQTQAQTSQVWSPLVQQTQAQPLQAQPSQVWSPPSQSPPVYTGQPSMVQVQPSEVQPPSVQQPQVQQLQVQPPQLQQPQVQPPQMKLSHQMLPPPIHQPLSPPVSTTQTKAPHDQVHSPPMLPSQPSHISKPYQNQTQPPQMTLPHDQVQPPPTQVSMQRPPVQQPHVQRFPVHPPPLQLMQPPQVLPQTQPPVSTPQTKLLHDQVQSPEHTQQYYSQAETAAQDLHYTQQGGTQQSLSTNYGVLPQASARQSGQAGNNPLYPQSSGREQGRQNRTQNPVQQIPQPQARQGHAEHLYTHPPSQSTSEQTANVQGPQPPHTNRQQHVNNVNKLPEHPSFDSQQSQLPQSCDSRVPVATACGPSTNSQTPYIQRSPDEQECAIPPSTNIQQCGTLTRTQLTASSNIEWYGSSHLQQASPLSTSAQGTNQLPCSHGASQTPSVHQDYSNPDDFGQSPMQYSTISLSGRRTGGLYSSSLPTLHERVDEPQTHPQMQESIGSHCPLQPHPHTTEHDKRQMNFRNQYPQNQGLDMKPQNMYTNEPQLHDNRNLTCDSQQTNMLDKTQAIPMENPQGKKNSSYQYSQIGGHNPAGDTSQQRYPESSRANVLTMASNGAPPHTQQQNMNMQGEGGINGNSRRIPLPQTKTSNKESGQGRVQIHTAPVGHHSVHSTQPPPLSHQPQSVYNQSNMQAGMRASRASEVTDGQSAVNGNVPQYYGAMDDQQSSHTHKATTAPQYLHSTAEDENNMSYYYHGSQSGNPNASRGATAQHNQYRNTGPPVNPSTVNKTQQSHDQVDPRTAASNTSRPLALSASQWQGRYDQQSSVSSEESSISSSGNHPTPQSSIESSSSSKLHQDTFHQNERARYPIHNQDEMAARQIHRSPSSGSEHSFPGSTTHARQIHRSPSSGSEHSFPGSTTHARQIHRSPSSGSEHSFPGSTTYAHSPSETEPVPPHIAAERRRAQGKHLGYFPSPERSLRQPIHPPDRRQYHRSDSAVTYPRHRSDPSMHRPPRRRRGSHPPRPHHQTAPVFFFLPQSFPPYKPYYGYDQDYESRHHRFTEQHYPEDIDEDDGYEYDDDNYEGEQEFWNQRQPSGATPQHTEFHSHHQRNPSEQEIRHKQQPPSGTDSRYTDYTHRERNPSESSTRQISHPTSSRSDSWGTDSSVSLDSPRVKSGPADMFPFISQQKDEHLIQVLGESDKVEEYSVVLMQPQHIDDLSSPWTAIFAVCRRRPNCINALLQIIQDPSGSKYNVSHINIFFEPEGELILNIPKKEAEKQGYAITSDTVPCLIRRFEATPTEDRPHANAVYPPRRMLTIYPHRDIQQRQRLNIQLELSGAKDCVRHFVLMSPLSISPAHQTTRQFTSTHLQHTHPMAPPIMEQSDILQSEPDVTKFLHMVGNKISLKWKALGAYLGVPTDEIQKIAHTIQPPADPTCCLAAVIEYWKGHQTDRPPTWNDLIAAVKQVDEPLTITIRHQLVSNSGQ